MAAKILTEGGLSCALLEAGPNVNPEKDFKMWTWPYQLPHRGAGRGHARENFSEFLAPNGAWQIDGEPYTSAPGANFQWFRSRIVGGRTNHWAASRCGLLPSISNLRRATASATTGPSPMKTSRRITTKLNPTSVSSARRKCFQRPGRRLSPSAQARCTELMVKKACDKLGIICIPSRLAILTRSVNGRTPCHYCGQCGRGCITGSNFSSSQVLLPPAMKRGS